MNKKVIRKQFSFFFFLFWGLILKVNVQTHALPHYAHKSSLYSLDAQFYYLLRAFEEVNLTALSLVVLQVQLFWIFGYVFDVKN